MKTVVKSPESAVYRPTPEVSSPKHRPPTDRNTSFVPLFPRNPHFPALRSVQWLFQRPSPQKQIPSSQPIKAATTTEEISAALEASIQQTEAAVKAFLLV